MSTEQVYQDALACQNGCNLQGILHTLNSHMPAIREDCVKRGKASTDDINQHPAVQVFLSKLVALAGGFYEPPLSAWRQCDACSRPPMSVQDCNTLDEYIWEPRKYESELRNAVARLGHESGCKQRDGGDCDCLLSEAFDELDQLRREREKPIVSTNP